MIWIAFYLAHFDSLMFFFVQKVCFYWICFFLMFAPFAHGEQEYLKSFSEYMHHDDDDDDVIKPSVPKTLYTLPLPTWVLDTSSSRLTMGLTMESWVDRSTVERDMCAQCILVGVYTTELKLWIDSTWPEIHIEEKLRHSVRPAQSSEHFDYFSRVVALSMKLVRKRKITIIQNSLTHRRFAELKQNLLNQLIMQF